MDVLSSQANLAGYRAVIESVEEFGKAVPMMMTAAGTITPAKIMVMGFGMILQTWSYLGKFPVQKQEQGCFCTILSRSFPCIYLFHL